MEDVIYRFAPLWGKWNVDCFLGSGSFGKVWKVSALDEILPAAVKEVQIPFSTGDLSTAASEGLDISGAKVYFRALLDETLKEVELMQELASCETVVHLYDYQVKELNREGEFGWVILIRMEHLVPFRVRFSEGLPVSEAARLGIDISYALEACGEKGIVHRDIKPDNLFYSPESGRYKLGDFGIAHYLARPTEGKGRAGTLTHMPPEVYQGAMHTQDADLYALGMILYRLLNHNRIPLLPPYPEPFTPVERDRALVRRLRGEEPNAPNVMGCADGERPTYKFGIYYDENTHSDATALGRIAWKAISARPEERYPSAKEFRKAIETGISSVSAGSEL
jgi:serine/threonine-protein kinase